jgi:CBS domain-containing protein
MLVKQILQQKGREVVTVAANATLADASRILATRRLGALVVQGGDGAIAGMLSERDIVRALAAHEGQACAQTVSRFMSSPVITCRETDTVEDLMELMTNRRFRHIPVLEGASLTGIVSIGDIVKSRIAETVAEAESLRSYIAAG